MLRCLTQCLTSRLQAVCISHLYLNLRHAATNPDAAQTSSASFQDGYLSRIVGSLDGSLVFASDDHGEGVAETDSDLSGDEFGQGDVNLGHVEMLNMLRHPTASSSRSDRNVMECNVPGIKPTT